MRAGASPFAVEWNALIDYLEERALRSRPEEQKHYRVQRPIYIQVCKADGTEEYMPVLIAGDPVPYESIPENAEIYDDPSP